MQVLSVQNVSKTFGSGEDAVLALDDVSFSIKKGEIFGLLGPNGAGKTTLISIIAGLLEGDGGDVKVFNLNAKKKRQKVKEMMNVVPGFTRCYSSLNVEEFLKMYAHLYSVPNWEKQREKMIKLLDLQDKRRISLKNLSSGYKQRVLLAKALMSRPKLLLMDEPTVGLDVQIAIKMRDLIKRLKKEGYTILLTTHNMLEVEELCDRIALISHGKIIVEGTIKDIKKQIVEQNGIEVECASPKKVAAMLKKESYVTGIKHMSNGFIVHVTQYRNIKKVMQKLSKIEEKVFSIKILEPTMEEAFIKLTKK